MPNIPSHIHLAYQAASHLDHPTINGRLGCFLLGSTAPDIRGMMRWPREQTHFVPLGVERLGAGVEGMFQAHPRLKDSSKLAEPTRAFVAGYINHLVADEYWILNVYRVHFDNHHSPGNQMQCDIWDRAIQLDMDRIARADMNNMTEVCRLLEGAEEGVEIGFIDGETLTRWRRWVQELNSWEFSWDRLYRMTRRMYGDNSETAQMTQEFIEGLPESLQRVYDLITPEGLASYRETTIQSSVKLIKEYLDAPAGDSGAGRG